MRKRRIILEPNNTLENFMQTKTSVVKTEVKVLMVAGAGLLCISASVLGINSCERRLLSNLGFAVTVRACARTSKMPDHVVGHIAWLSTCSRIGT